MMSLAGGFLSPGEGLSEAVARRKQVEDEC